MNQSPPSRQHNSFRGQIGIAQADITPPVGIYARNWGAAKHDVAESIHRPLAIHAMTVSTESGAGPLVLLDADLGWWRPLSLFTRFQQQILDALSLPSAQLMFALSHTHATAPLMDPDPSLPGSDRIGAWLETILESAIATAKKALANTFAATLDWHTGRCNLAANRDLPDPNREKDRMLCGFHPDGAADDTLLLGRITDQTGSLRATIVNYACHPTTLAWENRAISPDYPGAMRETMTQATNAPSFFLQGASGDLAPRYQYVGDGAVADRHGRQLAHAALATLHDMEPPGMELYYAETVESGAPLAVWRHRNRDIPTALQAAERQAPLKLKDWPTADELEKQRQQCTDRAVEERLRRRRDIRRVLGDGETFDVPVYAWRIGDAILVGCCCEAYSLLQQTLRERFPQYSIACMNLVNGSIGYLPPADRYDVDVYPVWQTPFARGGLETMLDTMTLAIEATLT